MLVALKLKNTSNTIGFKSEAIMRQMPRIGDFTYIYKTQSHFEHNNHMHAHTVQTNTNVSYRRHYQ